MITSKVKPKPFEEAALPFRKKLANSQKSAAGLVRELALDMAILASAAVKSFFHDRI